MPAFSAPDSSCTRVFVSLLFVLFVVRWGAGCALGVGGGGRSGSLRLLPEEGWGFPSLLPLCAGWSSSHPPGRLHTCPVASGLAWATSHPPITWVSAWCLWSPSRLPGPSHLPSAPLRLPGCAGFRPTLARSGSPCFVASGQAPLLSIRIAVSRSRLPVPAIHTLCLIIRVSGVERQDAGHRGGTDQEEDSCPRAESFVVLAGERAQASSKGLRMVARVWLLTWV